MKKLLKLSVLSISMITVMAGAAVSPALGNIRNAFPSASTNLIKMILTVPALFIIIFSLLSGKLASLLSKKQILITGILIYIIGGVGPIFANSLTLVLVFRAILGIGCGLIMPISQSLIADFFTGDERTKMTGYSSAASNLMGIISSIVVGTLSSINWKYGFYIYLIALVVLILNSIVLPKQKSEKKHKIKVHLNKRVYFLSVSMCLITIAFYAVPTNIALFMAKEHIGNSSSAGLAIAVFTFGGFIAGIILSSIAKKLEEFTITVGIGIMFLGYVVLLYSQNISMILVSVSLVGFAFSMIYPLIFLKTGIISDENSNSIAISIVSSSMFLGQFLSPIVLQCIGNILNNNSIRLNFKILSICLCSALVISLIFQFKLKMNKICVK
ncbi:MFS family permease [Clostridium tetanomorphum]|uniref:MFS transporter n=1 Tax=Clostridium tetanomorphum TaxID=1553 RepID=UPI0004532FD1|nr:MFS transporter [Clostridium tetanomorphum]KAJ52734.1 putative major facilitator superfamily protein [Clostridium tetanomorphum DSM 665]MBP1863329.1 MFS family permease [Clostridium tetanomorphum]NRS84437.1 MFS family permease [Clostridium tetanomorphum]SQB92068.1 transporter protein [Clostridium tetanomorphum]